MAEIGHFEWRGKHGELSESFFSPGKADAACPAVGLGSAESPLAGPGLGLQKLLRLCLF